MIALVASFIAAALAGDAEEPTVKVVVLHGSVGEWQPRPYHQRLQKVCKNIEVENLSKAGLGAWANKQRFKELVLDRKPDQEFWLLFGAGLNSVVASHKTNHHLREMIMLAHGKGMKVMGLTPTPWGTDAEEKWQGMAGLTRRRATQRVSDFILGKLPARLALGSYVTDRDDPDAVWDPSELPDVGVDVYDSGLRDSAAEPRDAAPIRATLERSRAWAKRHEHRSPEDREAAMDTDVALGTSVPQFYMRPELQSFDHIHPNGAGHRILAQTICPKAPESWGCSCDDL